MKRLRDKVRDRTGRNRVGWDIRNVIADLNPILRGWGNSFRTGNAGKEFGQVDDDVVWRLHCLMAKNRGRKLHAGQSQQWTENRFNGHGLHRGLRDHVKMIIGKPYAGKPHVRIERGMGKTDRPAAPAPLTTDGPARVLDPR